MGSLPPPSFTASEISVAGMLEPAYETGGDTYDYAYNAGDLSFGVLDAVGHDLAASVISTLAARTVQNCRRSGIDLVATGEAIDQVLDNQIGAAAYATGVIGNLDTATGRVCWLNGGHPPPLLIRNRRQIIDMASVGRVPFGLGHLAPRHHDLATAQLEPGDAVLLYTDGIIEARTSTGTDFGFARLKEFLVHAFAAGLSPAETVRRLSNAVLDHHNGKLGDDATTLLVIWHPV